MYWVFTICLALCNLSEFNTFQRHIDPQKAGRRRSRVFDVINEAWWPQECTAPPPHSSAVTRAPPAPGTQFRSSKVLPPPLVLQAHPTCGADGSRWRRPGGTLAPAGQGPKPPRSWFCKPASPPAPHALGPPPGWESGGRGGPSLRGCAVRTAPGRSALCFTLRLGSLCRPGGRNRRFLLSQSLGRASAQRTGSALERSNKVGGVLVYFIFTSAQWGPSHSLLESPGL